MARIRGEPVTIDEALTTLAGCGIRLRAGFDAAAVLESCGEEWFAENPYQAVIVTLGGEREEEPYDRLSDDVWHFDTECIEDHGDYAAIAERMRDLAGDALPLAEITDLVDVAEEGVAWLEFALDGERVHWDAAVDDDWVDPSIISRFAALLTRRNAGRRFTYLDLGGQDCVIGCAAPEQFMTLNRVTGLRFRWLT